MSYEIAPPGIVAAAQRGAKDEGGQRKRPPAQRRGRLTLPLLGSSPQHSEALRRRRGNEESRRPTPSGFRVAPPGLVAAAQRGAKTQEGK